MTNKTFKEFVAEAKKAFSHDDEHLDNHHEANETIGHHVHDPDGYDEHGYHEDGHHFHSHGVDPKAVAHLHKQLAADGWKKHEGDNHKPYAGSNHYPPEHKQDHYHKYTKGKTTVHIANHKNHDSGHVVEVLTPMKKKD